MKYRTKFASTSNSARLRTPMTAETNDASLIYFCSERSSRIPENHPLRPIRPLADLALERCRAGFDALYRDKGRPSIPPEQLLRGAVAGAVLDPQRAHVVEQLEYNLLFRWFVGLGMNDRAWNHACSRTTASGCWPTTSPRSSSPAWSSKRADTVALGRAFHRRRHADRSLGVAQELPAEGRFRRRRRRRLPRQQAAQRHAPAAKLYRKGRGQEAKLSYLGHVVIDNRHGLAVDQR